MAGIHINIKMEMTKRKLLLIKSTDKNICVLV